MRIKNLSDDRKEEILRAYKTTANVHEKIRYQSLKLLSEGYRRKEVSTITGLSEETIGVWVTAYNKHGISELREKRVTGNHKKLTTEQKDKITIILKRKNPKQYGFEGKFWTVELLKKLVTKEYGVTYKDKQSYRNLFSYAGFSFHKPEKVNQKQSPHMRKRFEQEIKKNSQSTGEKIAWYW